MSTESNHIENDRYLASQIITYLGNKRSLLRFIGEAIETVQSKLKKDRLSIFDAFSGSGIVSRFFRKYASELIVNDLETYAYIINSCYLSNASDRNMSFLTDVFDDLQSHLHSCESHNTWTKGLMSVHYAPQDDTCIHPGERVFYTTRNAHYIDSAREYIDTLPQHIRHFFLAPLLAEASVHTNTSGVFKGFYKNSETGIGQFGGQKQHALTRIMQDIQIPFPVFSNFDCKTLILQGNANTVIDSIDEVDIVYIDPPYNQHPYGSNYFMLNVIAENKITGRLSKVSGIDSEWNRSLYNKAREAFSALDDFIRRVKAKYVLLSFNSEGFLSYDDINTMLSRYGNVVVKEIAYNTFRASRNLHNRNKHVLEYLYILEKT
ncbi:MAG: DNA adenine methylase [Spirochaetales bacterium]